MSAVAIVAVSAVVSTLGLYVYRLYRRGQSSEEEDTEPHGASETVSSSSHGRDSTAQAGDDDSTTASRLSVYREAERWVNIDQFQRPNNSVPTPTVFALHCQL